MIVICITDSLDGASFIQGITKNKKYQVIAMLINLYNKDILYNIEDDFSRLSFYSHVHFNILDEKIEDDWVINKLAFDEYVLLPHAISYKTFYEDYHNDDPHAIEVFRKRYPSL